VQTFYSTPNFVNLLRDHHDVSDVDLLPLRHHIHGSSVTTPSPSTFGCADTDQCRSNRNQLRLDANCVACTLFSILTIHDLSSLSSRVVKASI